MSKKRREKRESTARRRASQKKSGFSTTKFQLPEGLGFWDFKDDVTRIDIVPYIAGKGNPWAKEGELHYERTYYQYRAKIGAEQKRYVTLGETFGVRDPIQEYRNEIARKVPQDKTEEDELNALVKSLEPSERQLWLIYDHNQKDKGVQLFDFSFHKFGRLLDKRVDSSTEEEAWDEFYFPDEDGFTLKVTWENDSQWGLGAVAIDFIARREPLPEEIVNHGYCLDDMLVQTPYEKLYAIFHHQQIDDDSAKNEDATGAESNTKQDSKTATQDEEEPKKESKKEKETTAPSQEKKSPSKTETQESPFKRLDVVEYEGKKCTIMKISGDGTSHTLVDDNDDMIKAVSADEMKPWVDKKEKPKQEEKEPEEDEAPFDSKDDDDDDDDENPWDDDF